MRTWGMGRALHKFKILKMVEMMKRKRHFRETLSSLTVNRRPRPIDLLPSL